MYINTFPKNLFLIIVLTISCQFFMPIVLFATDVYVDSSWTGSENGSMSQPYNTIGEGLASLTSGLANTLNLKGNFNEAVVINKSGQDAENPLIIQNWNGNVFIDGSGKSNAQGITISNSMDYITIQSSGGYSFTIQDFEERGIYGDTSVGNSSDYLKISGLNLTNNSTDLTAYRPSGIELRYAKYATIENNVISPIRRGAIHLTYSLNSAGVHTVVSGNTILGASTANSKAIAVLQYGTYIDILNNTITTSWASDATSDISGILVQDSNGSNAASDGLYQPLTNIVIDGNTVTSTNSPLLYSGNGVGIQAQDCVTCTISDNVVGSWGEDGIEVDDLGTPTGRSCDVIVERNLVYNTHGKSGGATANYEMADMIGDVTMSDCPPVILRNNISFFDDPSIVADSGLRGFGTHSGSSSKTRLEYYNNTCYSSLSTHANPCYRFNSLYSLTFKNNIGRNFAVQNVIDASTIANITMDHNSLHRVDDGIVLRVIGVGDYTEDSIAAGSLYNAAGLEPPQYYLGDDPAFVNPPTDFTLQSGDARIDSGVAITGFSNDYNSKVRPQGGGWDLGAVEFGNVSTPPPAKISTPGGFTFQ